MPRRAFILGGTGQIGRPTARRLQEAGWDVTTAARTGGDVQLDRKEPGALEQALGDGYDVLVDIVPFTREDGEQLATLAGRVGSVIAVSSASVYCDDDGRTLDEAESAEDFPRLPVPIPEGQRTVEPGPETYSTAKRAMELALLEQDALPATVLRPCAIHGPHTKWSREWHFVKRILDGRRVVLLGDRGKNLFHTTSVANLAELILVCAESPGTRPLNAADPDPPDVLRIARAIAAGLEHEWTECLLPWGSELGDNQWRVPRPLLVDMSAAEELGYRPVTTYEEAVPETAGWLVEATRDRDWTDVLPLSARFMADAFDYEAEDEYVRSLAS